MRRPGARVTAVLAVLALLGACASTQSRFSPIGDKTYPPRSASSVVEVFETEAPGADRPYERIARLDVHLEKTGFNRSTLEDAMPELMRQARAAGGDAIIDIKQQQSAVLETRILHVTATAIRFVEATH